MGLLDSIRRSLARRWGFRITTETKNASLEGDTAVREAFLAGYRRGYWHGVEDLAESGADADSAKALLMSGMSTAVH